MHAFLLNAKLQRLYVTANVALKGRRNFCFFEFVLLCHDAIAISTKVFEFISISGFAAIRAFGREGITEIRIHLVKSRPVSLMEDSGVINFLKQKIVRMKSVRSRKKKDVMSTQRSRKSTAGAAKGERRLVSVEKRRKRFDGWRLK